jgi:hypothetical protein
MQGKRRNVTSESTKKIDDKLSYITCNKDSGDHTLPNKILVWVLDKWVTTLDEQAAA